MFLQNIKEEWLPRLLPLVAKLEFNGTERQKLWRNLAEKQRFDLSIDASLQSYRDRQAKNNPLLAMVFDAILAARKDSHSLDAALAGFVPPEECMLIRAGMTNNLADVLDLCADLIAAKQKISNGLINALFYPVVLLTSFVTLLAVISIYVMPQLALLGDPENWGTTARALFTVSGFIASAGGMVVLVVFLAVVVFSLASLPLWTGPLRLKVESMPPWSFYRLINGSIWMFTVATMMRANMSFQFILEDMAGMENMSPWLRERVQAILKAYRNAEKLATTLKNTNMNFPDKELLDDLQAYEELPSFHTHFYALTKHWLDTSQERIERKLKAVGGALIALVGLFICALGVASGSLQQSLFNSGGF